MSKKWLTNCWLLIVVAALETSGRTSLYAEGQRLGLRFLDQGITRESRAATQLLSAPSLTLYVKAKYRILDKDTYNFDETGFQIGVGGSVKVVTASKRRLKPLSVQPSNCE
jgi:hypothetical protein